MISLFCICVDQIQIYLLVPASRLPYSIHHPTHHLTINAPKVLYPAFWGTPRSLMIDAQRVTGLTGPISTTTETWWSWTGGWLHGDQDAGTSTVPWCYQSIQHGYCTVQYQHCCTALVSIRSSLCPRTWFLLFTIYPSHFGTAAK